MSDRLKMLIDIQPLDAAVQVAETVIYLQELLGKIKAMRVDDKSRSHIKSLFDQMPDLYFALSANVWKYKRLTRE